MYARRGEVQAARAAAQAGVPFSLSTVGICSVEEVARDATPPWFQLYVLKDRGYMRELVRRARSAGCPVLVLTVDLPVPGARYRDMRSGFRGLTGTRCRGQSASRRHHPSLLGLGCVAARPPAHLGLGGRCAAVGRAAGARARRGGGLPDLDRRQFRPLGDLVGSRLDTRRVERSDRDQGRARSPRMRATRSRWAPRASWCRTTAAGSSTACARRSRLCRASWMRSARTWKCSSTAAFAPGSMC